MKAGRVLFMAGIILLSLSVISCSDENTSDKNQTDNKSSGPHIKEESVTYTSDNLTSKGYVVYDENKRGKRPGVIVVHEWWGAGDYERRRAKQLAEMGYIALVADMYGNGKTAATPQEAAALVNSFDKNLQRSKGGLDAALKKLKRYPETDTANIAAIGYCFGGGVVLNAAQLGADLKGVVMERMLLPILNLLRKEKNCKGLLNIMPLETGVRGMRGRVVVGEYSLT